MSMETKKAVSTKVQRGEGSTREQENVERKWHVHCPVCGCKLARSKNSDSDIDCHKCHSTIGILVSDGIVTVVDRTDRSSGKHNSRAAMYIEKLSQLMKEE